jgi:hypothetical protein
MVCCPKQGGKYATRDNSNLILVALLFETMKPVTELIIHQKGFPPGG